MPSNIARRENPNSGPFRLGMEYPLFQDQFEGFSLLGRPWGILYDLASSLLACASGVLSQDELSEVILASWHLLNSLCGCPC